MEVSSAEEIQVAVKSENLPEGIGEGEDSGFASIAGGENPQNEQKPDPDELVRIKEQKRLEEYERVKAVRRATQERYNEENRQKTYKRLLHLVTQSKFYSDFLVKKLSPEDSSGGTKAKRAKKRKVENKLDADAWGPKKIRSNQEAKAKNDLKKIVPKEVKEQVINERDRLNSSHEDEELGAEGGEKPLKEAFVPPKYFTGGELYDYQQDGLQWLKALYENGISGILADEMGLGKTIQVIAMIAHLIEQKQAGPFLILAPLSTIPNWLMEFERFAPKIPVVLFYGDQGKRDEAAEKMMKRVNVDGFMTHPVVLTTYEVPLREKGRLSRQNWRYLVIDEGQRIKNSESQLAILLESYKSISRLLLTGTPLQNEMKELWALLHFLMPDIFDDLLVFQSWLNVEDFQDEAGTNRFLQQEKDKNILQSFRDILKPFMLRRMKADVCLGIPPKKEVLVYAPMTKLQHNLYAGLLNYDLDVFSKVKTQPLIIDDESGKRPIRKCAYNNIYSGFYRDPYAPSTSSATSSHGSASSNKPQTFAEREVEKIKEYANVTDVTRDYFVRLAMGHRPMVYRKIINHPYLIHMPLDCGLPKIDEEVINSSGKMMVLDKMLQKLHAGGHRVLLFSTLTSMLDIIEDYLMMRPWNYLRLDGNVKIEDRTESLKAFSSDPDYFLFLISTRAGGVGLNLASADTAIIFDSDWNPQVDIQAMARCHRIGQTKPVVVYRLCTKGSYDEAIVSRAQAKRTLEKLVISKEIEEITCTGEGLIKLKRILDSCEHVTVDSEQEVFSEEELNKILDRSDLFAQMVKPDEAEKRQ